jgi:hypothetical protein
MVEATGCHRLPLRRKPGKWRASVKRSDGTPLGVVGPHKAKIAQTVTHIDSLTAEEALRMAIEAIDAGAFSYRATPARAPEGVIAS